MPAYIIADIDVIDPEGYERYKKQASEAVAAYGGKYVVRGGSVEALEGGWKPKRLVVLAFQSLDQARRFYESPQYAEARKIRRKCASTNMILVEAGEGTNFSDIFSPMTFS